MAIALSNRRAKTERRRIHQGCYSSIVPFARQVSPRDRARLAMWCQAVDAAESGEDEEQAYQLGSALMEHLERIGLLKQVLAEHEE